MTEKRQRIGARLKVALTAMVEEGISRKEAAALSQMTDHALYCALRKPHVCAFRSDLMRVLRESEASRTIARAAKLADSAVSEHVRLGATQWLAGIEGIVPLSRSENVHIHQGSPGLVIVYGDMPAELLEGVTPHPAMRGRVIEARARDVALISGEGGETVRPDPTSKP